MSVHQNLLVTFLTLKVPDCMDLGAITGTTNGMAFSNRIYSSLRCQKPDFKGLQS